VSLFCLVGEIVDITAILPQSQPLIVMPPVVTAPHTMRIPDEERTDVVLNTEVDHLACGLMSLVTDTSRSPAALLVLGTLQFLPPPRKLGASGLLFRYLADLLIALSLEGTDSMSCDNQGFSCVRGHCCKVDFSKINRCMNIPRGVICLWYLNTDMQLKTMVPHQRTGTARLWKVKRKYQRSSTLAHWQHHTPTFT
jgi:hypothetical protein